ncbi:MAG: AI-2E family transporter [Actinomycetota bacterium]|nr:AI-2E family transporter [Actinomycetota bacterium]
MRETARRAFIAAVVVVGVVVAALALWELRLLIAILFLAFIVSAAMRPGVESLRRYGIPRPVGILVHYAALFALVALLLWRVVPAATTQIREALGGVPTTRSELKTAAAESTGIKQEILVGVQRRLEELPEFETLVARTLDPALEFTVRAFEIFVGIFFTLAAAAYWIYERDRAVALVTSLLPRNRRKIVRDTWNLIDLKLGAYVRGQVLLVLFVATVLSLAFWAIGLPFWLLLGAFAGVVEIIPVIGPLAAGVLAVGVGVTQSWQVALAAGLVVLFVRLLEDYLVVPRVLGDAVGLSPLTVLVAVSSVAILFGGFAVLLAIPIAAVIATLVDVLLRHRDPAKEEVPTVIFPAKEVETR